jgi:hypothetical protein
LSADSPQSRVVRARESEALLCVAGQRVKILLALFPSALHLDPPPGSGSFAFRIPRTENSFTKK